MTNNNNNYTNNDNNQPFMISLLLSNAHYVSFSWSFPDDILFALD